MSGSGGLKNQRAEHAESPLGEKGECSPNSKDYEERDVFAKVNEGYQKEEDWAFFDYAKERRKTAVRFHASDRTWGFWGKSEVVVKTEVLQRE